MSYDLFMDGMEAVIDQLEAQKDAIDKALAALRGVAGTMTPTVSDKPASGNARSIAQKARWAAKRSAEEAAPKSARKGGGGLTAAGRKRLADNMRKRWAAKRTAAQAHKRGRKAA